MANTATPQLLRSRMEDATPSRRGVSPPRRSVPLLDAQENIRPLLEFLAEDERPTFIIEDSSPWNPPRIVFQNAALESLLLMLGDQRAFDRWLVAVAAQRAGDVAGRVQDLGDRAWYSKRFRQEWKIVWCRQAHEQVGPVEPVADVHAHARTDSNGPSASTPQSTWGDVVEGGRKILDWTRESESSPNPWISLIKSHSWADTDFGPMNSWPEELCYLAVLVMACPDPRMVYWGNEQAILYNEPAAALIGHRHPEILGKRFVDVWGPDIYHRHIDMVQHAIFEGRSQQANNFHAILERNGLVEETYWNIHLLPVPGPDGHTIAAINEYTESTSAVYHEQRRILVARISEHTSLAESLSSLWSTCLSDLKEHLFDVSYAAIYTTAADNNRQHYLEGSVGVDPKTFPAVVDITRDSSEPTIATALRQAQEAHHLVVLSLLEGNLPQGLAIDTLNRGKVTHACILPISSISGHHLASIVIGINPQRPFTEETRLFVSHIRDLILKFAVVISLPEEQRRDMEKFQQVNISLTQQLRITALKAEKNEETFVRMARNAPFGMYMYSPTGEPKFVNDSYLELLSMTRAELEEKAATGYAWRDTVYDEDIEFIANTWVNLTQARTPTKIEYRIKTPSKNPGEPDGWKWVENVSFPELDDEGNVVTVMGWLYDISHRKLTEALMAQRLEDALENKRASERFIVSIRGFCNIHSFFFSFLLTFVMQDMTSHEMRNPLSAILQLADEIDSSLTPPAEDETSVTIPRHTAASIIDAAQTIMLCAQHQKNIVDDVLTISKLDSNLLVITPDTVRPTELIHRALKMYEAELGRADIRATMEIKQSYLQMDLDLVMLDPSRLLQVIINLLTNAIKFTSQETERREIIISLSATDGPPTGEEYNIMFAPQRQKNGVTPTPTTADWGSGEEVYLQFAVTDTGKGLTEDEMKLLFHRFSQANPKTYKRYGGSGLGLFISKELTELQGGQIGVQSKAGIGSTFTFYIKARRCVDIGEELQRIPSAAASVVVDKIPATDRNHRAPALETLPKLVVESVKDVKDQLHVLVVEDNAINQRVMAQQLRRLGCIVEVADHGLDALSFLATTTFYRASRNVPLSIVLMDLEMPVMDGLTAVRRIRKLEQTGEIVRHVPVIAITANARSEQISTALEAGMDEVVSRACLFALLQSIQLIDAGRSRSLSPSETLCLESRL